MSETAVLRRLVQPAPQREKEEEPHIRTMRRVIAQAGELALGVPLTLQHVQERTIELSDVADVLPSDGLIQSFERHGRIETVWAYDQICVEACVEAQTKGFLSEDTGKARDTTAIDRALTNALAEYIIPAVAMAEDRPPAMDLGKIFETPQDLVLNLPAQPLPVMELDLDFDKGTRKGRVIIVTVSAPVARLAAPEGKGWASALTQAVESATVTLDARLHKTAMTWSMLQNLKVGATVLVPKKALSDVALVGCTGKTVARARLGQIGGMKALRVLDPPSAENKAEAALGFDGVADLSAGSAPNVPKPAKPPKAQPTAPDIAATQAPPEAAPDLPAMPQMAMAPSMAAAPAGDLPPLAINPLPMATPSLD